ncbi:MAG TPA: TonB-dependent receptor [Hyphomicrobiales bacterium]|nr:TonB-dependent receptor [Hyphomicrobiales bacterium]
MRDDALPGFRAKAFVLAVGCALASVAVLAPSPILAAESVTGAASREYAVSAGRLSDVLAEFATLSGVQLIFDPRTLAGLSSNGLQGRYSVREGFAQLLAGSGYELVDTGDGYSLRQVTVGTAGAITLPPVRVAGTAINPTSVLGTLPEAYAGGQIARGGQVGMLGNRDVMDTPFSQTSYTNKTIQDQQARTLNDVLVNEPSVIIGTKGGGRNDWWTFRGFPVQTYGASNSLNGLAGMAPLNYPSTDFIERVEVLRGPNTLLKGTTMNGMAALGGTVDLVTKRASDDALTQLSTRYISDAQFGIHADVGRRFGTNEAFGMRFNGSLDGGDTPVNTQESKFRTAALNLDYRGERVRVSADFAHQSSSLSSPSSTLTINGVSGVLASLTEVPAALGNEIAFSPSWAEGKHEVTLGMLQGEVDIMDNVTAYAAIGKQRYKAAATDDDLLLLDSAGAVGIRAARFRDRTDVLSMQGGVNAKMNTGSIGHALSLNLSRIEWTYDSTPLSRAGAGAGAIIPVGSLYDPIFPTTPVFPPYQDILPAINTQSSSVAIADTISFMDERVQFTAGARYNEIESHSLQYASTNIQSAAYKSSAWSPSLALVVKPWENVSLYANYIQALEVGSTAGSSYANAGEVFPPYTSKQYEAGVKKDWGAVTTTLAAFQIAQPSTMSVPDAAGGLPALTLDGEQRNRGIELTAYGELFDGVRLLSGVTLMEATQTKNDNDRNGWRAANTPKFRAVIGGEWDTPFMEGVTLTGRLTHTGNIVALNRRPDLTIPSWTQVDIGARYSLAGPWNDKPIALRFDIDNVFDTNYWKASHPTAGNLMKSDPRTFRLSATVDF